MYTLLGGGGGGGAVTTFPIRRIMKVRNTEEQMTERVFNRSQVMIYHDIKEMKQLLKSKMAECVKMNKHCVFGIGILAAILLGLL